MADVLFFRGASKIHVLNAHEGKTLCGKPWAKPRRVKYTTEVCATCSKQMKGR